MATKKTNGKGEGGETKVKLGGWFVTGKEGIAKSKQEDEISKQRREQRKDMPWRFRLDNGEEAKATFLGTPKFFYREHNLQLGGKWGNYFTCLMDFDTCPLDTIGNSSYVVAGSVIDHREWEDKKGEKHKNQKRMVVFKGKARENIIRQIEKKGDDLKYWVYEFSRGSSNTEAATGENFEPVKQLTKDQMKNFIPKGETLKWLEEFDYAKILEPKSPEELRKIAGQAPPTGSAEELDSGDTDADEGTKKGKKTKQEDDDMADLL
jgi:hypothetical protein